MITKFETYSGNVDIFDAIENIKLAAVNYFLRSGVDVNCTKDTRTTIMFALIEMLYYFDSSLVKSIKHAIKNNMRIKGILKIIDLLIHYGADWNKKDKNGESFFDVLKTHDEELINYFKKKYPEEYRNSEMFIDADKFNL